MSIAVDFMNWQKQSPFEEMRRDPNGRIADNFGCLLFHLIGKSDMENRGKLRVCYPKHVEAWERWMEASPEPSPEEIPALFKQWGIEDQ